jgi:hypothetical protein
MKLRFEHAGMSAETLTRSLVQQTSGVVSRRSRAQERATRFRSLLEIENLFVAGEPLQRLGGWDEYGGVKGKRREDRPWLQKAAGASLFLCAPLLILFVLGFGFG